MVFGACPSQGRERRPEATVKAGPFGPLVLALIGVDGVG